MSRTDVVLAVAAAAALWPLAASALDADDALESTNRVERPIEELFKTDSIYPEEPGEFELEIVSLWQNYRGGNTYSVPVQAEYGITSAWQVEAEWDSYVWRHSNGTTSRGIGDLEAGTQYSFMNIEGTGFHLAPRISVEAPLASVNKGIGEGLWEIQPALILARDFPNLHRTQVFAETGLAFACRGQTAADPDEAIPAAHELNLGAGFFTLFAQGAATMEFNWSNNKWNHHGDDNELYVTPGILWRPRRHMELGLGVPIGLTRGSDRVDISAHLVWEF